MLLNGLLLPIVFASYANAVWYKDIISPKGWEFGDGMIFHVEDTKNSNSSFFDRIALRVDYGNVAVSAVPKPEKEAVQLDFFVKDQQEGRSKKTMGNMLIPFWLGAAKGTAVTTLLAGMKLMALKSLLIAKIAVIISAVIIASKFLKKSEPYYVEVEQSAGSHPVPVYEFPGENHVVDQQVYAYSPYHAYAPSASDAAGNYATVVEVAGGENETAAGKQYALPVPAAAKRKDPAKRKFIPASTVLTIKHYNKPNSLL
ncbi:unnamed protein product [Phyllotreta striolata]|uniref:Uncharacterized protein n=1 Tax=Phyllotreta striolata TaxID=444603 RepID=A0A9N9TSY1_PHYSR|nr:unnamed protein product [Phyllotreta striolata]